MDEKRRKKPLRMTENCLSLTIRTVKPSLPKTLKQQKNSTKKTQN